MNVACPHCRGRYLPLGEVWFNGASLMGARSPLRCPGCGGLSHARFIGRNAAIAVALLLVGVVLSYPSAISNALLARVPQYEAAAIRVDIWALAFLAASSTFGFAAPLHKMEGADSVPPHRLLAALGAVAFFGSLFLYGYFLFDS
jgi:hypothetical protein